MEPITTTTSLWGLLKDSKIIIPTFQRDYAQGRVGKEELRKKFLGQIKKALDNNEELLLDFVYGTKNREEMYPLDGQQRLTTIWTLMWYATLKTKDEDTRNERLCILRNFSYETRRSSRDFIEWLCNENTIESLIKNKKTKLSDSIQKQNGFYLGWNQDPTVQSILRMLSGTSTKNKKTKEVTENKDGIECIFSDDSKLGNLFDVENSPIKFYHLNLSGIKQPDNLYVKMNARGEQLTGFENFKADLIGNFLNKEDLNGFVTPTVPNYILTNWDINWTNFFWQNRGKQNSIDDIFFTFIKRFLLNRYNAEIKKNNKEKDSFDTLLFDNEQKEYTTYDSYEKLIDKKCIEELTRVLNGIGTILPWLSEAELPLLKNKKFAFLPQYDDTQDKSVKDISLQARVIMYGICLYLQKVENLNKVYFTRWLRVLSNLAYYNEISNYEAFVVRLKFIYGIVIELANNNCFEDIYSKKAVDILNKYTDNNHENENTKQLKEEIKKINKITEPGDNEILRKENSLKKLESLWIFSGHIDCLLDRENLYEDKLYEIINESIDTKKEKDEGIKHLCGYEKLIALFQAILCYAKSDCLEDMKINNEHDGLRKLLNNSLKVSFNSVLDEILKNNQIENIIKNYNDDDWKFALIKDAGLWNYALKGKFKKYREKYYLYRGSNKHDADIPLCEYSSFLRNKFNNNHITSEITFNEDENKWSICVEKETFEITDWDSEKLK